MNIKSELKYTKDHEWIEINGNTATVGITDYAQESLGDITFVEFPLAGEFFNMGDTFGVVESVKAASDLYIVYVEVETVDESLKQEEVFGSVEAVKTVSDLFIPVSGKVIEVNQKIEDSPEIINEDPYGDGWIIKMEIDDENELNDLLDADAYAKLIGA